MIYTISTLKRKAREDGYSLREGFQKYHHSGWGYRKDGDGNKIRGYEVFDYSAGAVIAPCDLYSYHMTIDEAVELLQELCGQKV